MVVDGPPEPLSVLLLGKSTESRDFYENIRRYNNSFVMTSYPANEDLMRDFGGDQTTYKVQGVIYRSLFAPTEDNAPNFSSFSLLVT